jgi:predicted NAD-dependent protein-ADP-ribosyltransferase YbiA (DUF1768 family)
MAMADKFFFFSMSIDESPGKGAKEHGDPDKYASLARFDDWRKTLSDCHTTPFVWRGYTWNSIEHAFQAMKIGLQDPDKAYDFTVDSGHFIGRGDGCSAYRHRKYVALTQENVDQWARTGESSLHQATAAKYAQNARASAVLEATGDAELWHVAPRGRAHRSGHLENIRARRRAAARCAPVKPPASLKGLKGLKGDGAARAAREARALARALASDVRDEHKDDGDSDDEFYIKYHTSS